MASRIGTTEAQQARRVLALVALLVVLLASWASPARAASFEWTGDCAGNTSWYATCTIGECSPGVGKRFNNWGQWACAPEQPAFPGSGDTVTLNAVVGLDSDATAGSLSLDASAVLDKSWNHTRLVVETSFTNEGELTLRESGTLVPWGTFTNNGMISMEWGGYYGNGIIEVPTAVTLQGTGEVLFALSTGPQTIVGAGALTQAAGHTIHGGHGAVDVALVNQGLVDADVDGGTIRLRAAAKTNQALLRASNGGTLEITAAVTQQGAGQIVASGAESRVTLVGGGQVTGGTLSGTGGGTVTVPYDGSATVNDVTGTGSWTLEQGATLNVGGTTWTDNASVDMYWGTLNLIGPVTVAGSGEVILGGPYGSWIQGAALDNAASHTIRGWGEIRASLANHGTVRADHPTADPYGGARLVVKTNAKTNHGVMEAVSSGSLYLATAVDQSGSGELRAVGAGSYLVLGNGAEVTGGTLSGSGGGLVGVQRDHSATVNDVTGTGSWKLEQGSTLNVGGTTWTNDASVEMYWGTLNLDDQVTVAGSGELILGGPYGSWIQGAALDNAASHTIRGRGEIRASLTNHGTVRADYPTTDPYGGARLIVNTSSKTNHAVMEAVSSGSLYVATAVDQSGSGQLRAVGAGSYLVLGNGAEVTGGTLSGSGGGLVGVRRDHSATVNDVTGTGSWKLEQGSTLNVGGTSWTNDASVEMYWGTLDFDEQVTVAGSGELILGGPYGSWMYGAGLVNGAGHTIRGYGEIALPVTNHGTVRADAPGAAALTLNPQTPGFTNHGTLEVSTGCRLYLNSADLFSQSGGETLVDGTLYVSGGDLTLSGGALAGNGAVVGSVVNVAGSASPGRSAGLLTVSGDYSQGNAATLHVQVGGPNAISDYDQLEVTGAAALDGTLMVSGLNGYVPADGETFTILTASSVSGQFDRVTTGGGQCDLVYTVSYGATSVTLTAVPSSAGVLCDGFETGNTTGWTHAVP